MTEILLKKNRWQIVDYDAEESSFCIEDNSVESDGQSEAIAKDYALTQDDHGTNEEPSGLQARGKGVFGQGV